MTTEFVVAEESMLTAVEAHRTAVCVVKTCPQAVEPYMSPSMSYKWFCSTHWEQVPKPLKRRMFDNFTGELPSLQFIEAVKAAATAVEKNVVAPSVL